MYPEAELLIELTKYWYGLFSHQRDTACWKGMLQLELESSNRDADALDLLASIDE